VLKFKLNQTHIESHLAFKSDQLNTSMQSVRISTGDSIQIKILNGVCPSLLLLAHPDWRYQTMRISLAGLYYIVSTLAAGER